MRVLVLAVVIACGCGGDDICVLHDGGDIAPQCQRRIRCECADRDYGYTHYRCTSEPWPFGLGNSPDHFCDPGQVRPPGSTRCHAYEDGRCCPDS